MIKASAYNAGDPGLIPGSGRSPGEGNGTPLQYSCLGNPMDRGAWRARVHRVATQSRLSNFTSHVEYYQKKLVILIAHFHYIRNLFSFCVITYN